jgi:hypothetical protein
MTPDDIDDVIERKEALQKEAEERNLRLSKAISDKIALDIITMLQKQHPGMHPAIVTSALVSCMATLIALFAGTDMAKALEGSDVTQRQLRTMVIGLMGRKAAGPAKPTIIMPHAAPN